MAIHIIRKNIVELEVDAIVNAANTMLQRGGGVCGAIFQGAASKKLDEECSELAPIKTGEAVMTNGYNLKAKYIIHTAGPIYQDGSHNEDALLQDSYQNSLELGFQEGLNSIAFPLISTGIYGYPKKEAMEIAIETMKNFLKDYEMEIYIAVLNKEEEEYLNHLLQE
ncbi:MAG: macro domain-containing protein [Tissierellia bacterium]|nr:macro domain-containing protein [Tissierellia bacterium]